MRERTRSFGWAIGAGALLGGIALVARYAPAPSSRGPARSPGSGASSQALAALRPPAARPPPGGGGGAGPLGEAGSLAAPPRYLSDPPADAASRAACPPGMTLVDGEFCPTLTYLCLRPTGAVGCAEYARDARCAGPAERRRFCVDRYEWPGRVGENPLVYVDWFEARALCAGAGKRLCRRSEWMLACEGPKRLPYPWGYVRQPSPCNIDRASIPFDVEAMIDARTREDELARLWQADRIGAHPDCVSAYGAYDLSGNVDEWTDDQADDPSSPHPSTLNGGYWGPVRDTCRLTTTSHGPTFRFYQVGFRCCGDAAAEARGGAGEGG